MTQHTGDAERSVTSTEQASTTTGAEQADTSRLDALLAPYAGAVPSSVPAQRRGGTVVRTFDVAEANRANAARMVAGHDGKVIKSAPIEGGYQWTVEYPA